MRLAPLVVMVALPLIAHAQATKPAVIEKLIGKHVTALAGGKEADLSLATNAVVTMSQGRETSEETGDQPSIIDSYHQGPPFDSAKHKLGKVSLAIDDAKGIAYFQAPFTTEVKRQPPFGTLKSSDRIGGIAVRDGTDWKFAAVMYSVGLNTDAIVMNQASGGELPKGEPALLGDDAIAKVVRGWFTSGFAPAAAKSGKRIASGTGPKEFQVDAAAVKLATTWDKLKLAVHSIHATKLGGGVAAYVEANVIWPAQKGKKLVPLKLGMVLVADGSDWRWVSMQFSPMEVP